MNDSTEQNGSPLSGENMMASSVSISQLTTLHQALNHQHDLIAKLQVLADRKWYDLVGGRAMIVFTVINGVSFIANLIGFIATGERH